MLAQATGRIAAHTGHNAGRFLVFGEKPLGTHDKGLLHKYNLLGLYVLSGHQVASQLLVLLHPKGPAAALVLWPMLLLVLPVAVAHHLAAGAGERSGHIADGTVGTQSCHSNDHFTAFPIALMLRGQRKSHFVSSCKLYSFTRRPHNLFLACFSKHLPLLTRRLPSALFSSFPNNVKNSLFWNARLYRSVSNICAYITARLCPDHRLFLNFYTKLNQPKLPCGPPSILIRNL